MQSSIFPLPERERTRHLAWVSVSMGIPSRYANQREWEPTTRRATPPVFSTSSRIEKEEKRKRKNDASTRVTYATGKVPSDIHRGEPLAQGVGGWDWRCSRQKRVARPRPDCFRLANELPGKRPFWSMRRLRLGRARRNISPFLILLIRDLAIITPCAASLSTWTRSIAFARSNSPLWTFAVPRAPQMRTLRITQRGQFVYRFIYFKFFLFLFHPYLVLPINNRIILSSMFLCFA